MKKYTHLNEVNIDEAFSDSGFVLGVDENGEVKRVPKVTMGKVKSVNGNEPDENGNIEIPISSAGGVQTVNGEQPDENGNVKVCEALKDVGEQGFTLIKDYDGLPEYAFVIEPWTGNDVVDLTAFLGGRDLENSSATVFKVILDGTAYLCPNRLWDWENGLYPSERYIGNGSIIFEYEEDNGLPFVIYYDVGYDKWYGKVLSDGEHNCQVYGGVYATIQVPEELVSQKVIAISLDELKNYTEEDLKEMLKNKQVINLLEYDFDDHCWYTYTLAGLTLDDGGGPMANLVFTCLSAESMIDPNFENVSTDYEIRTIIFMESVENHYFKITKNLS